MRPHRRRPTRLPRPWDSPGKNTGVGCHVLLQCMKGKSESEVAQSCPTLRDPMDCSLPGSSVHGIFPGKSIGVGCHCLLALKLEGCSQRWKGSAFKSTRLESQRPPVATCGNCTVLPRGTLTQGWGVALLLSNPTAVQCNGGLGPNEEALFEDKPTVLSLPIPSNSCFLVTCSQSHKVS